MSADTASRRLELMAEFHADGGTHDVFAWFAKRELDAKQKAAPPPDVGALQSVILDALDKWATDAHDRRGREEAIAAAIAARYGAPGPQS